MTNWMQYLLEVNIYLAVAYGCYWLLLRRQTFYAANRVYLLASALLCFAIPLVQVTFSAPTSGVVAMAQAQEVLIQSAPAATPPLHPQAVFDTFKAVTAIYITGAVLGLVLLSLKLSRLLKLIFSSKKQKHEGYTLVFVPGIPSPFSFMHYLFVAGKEQLQPVILQHELVHISQKHSCDVLFAELLKIICWFNPAVYLLQNSLKALHEFEADRLTAENTEQDGYVDFLIAQACHNNGISFANHFSEKQLLKSRIMKLYQKRSGKLARLNYLMALPLCAGMLCASSVAFSKDFGLKFDLGKTSESKQKNSSDEVLFPPPVVRPADGKVSSKRTAGFESVIAPKHSALQKDSVKKLRLKVTSGNTSGITDKLKLSGASGKDLVYTAQTLTQQDQKDLKQRFGIDVETTSATGSMTNIMVLPPPPPVDPRNPKKNRYPLIPPPPPPAEKRTSAKKTIKPPPPPPVEANFIQKELTTDENRRLKQGDTIVTFSFQDLLKHVSRTMRYPTDAQKNNITGSLLTSFTVDKNQKISNVAVKKGTNADLDAEAVKVLSAYKGTAIAKPGTYTLRLSFKLQYADGTESESNEKKADQEKATAGDVAITAYGGKK